MTFDGANGRLRLTVGPAPAQHQFTVPPVRIKTSAGGGALGMRVASDTADLLILLPTRATRSRNRFQIPESAGPNVLEPGLLGTIVQNSPPPRCADSAGAIAVSSIADV